MAAGKHPPDNKHMSYLVWFPAMRKAGRRGREDFRTTSTRPTLCSDEPSPCCISPSCISVDTKR